MSIEIGPSELAFHRPFTTEVQETLNLKNTSTSPIAFKVKTTAPRQYCVRPNSGRIEPGQDVDVTVILQAMKVEPPPDTKCRDKFLVQSAVIDSSKHELDSVASILDNTRKTDIQEKKIRVTWVRETESPQANDVLGTPKRDVRTNSISTPDAPRQFSSPSQPSITAQSAHNEVKSEPIADEPSIMESVNSSPPAYQAVDPTKPATDETVGLRQRTAPQVVSDEKKSTFEKKSTSIPVTVPTSILNAQRAATEGVPVKVVALLCMVSFLLAYFFF